MAEEQKEVKPLSRSEREALIKDKAGLVINIFALLLAVNAWYGGKLSSTIMNNTINANNTYAFYQAKALKKTLAENELYAATKSGDTKRAAEMAIKGGPKPSELLTKSALKNASVVLQATSGSTNAIVHLTAIAGRADLVLRKGSDHSVKWVRFRKM